MPTKLDDAIARAQTLPVAVQDDLAALLIEEMEDRAFDDLIASRPDVLDRLAAKARPEIAAGFAEPLGYDPE